MPFLMLSSIIVLLFGCLRMIYNNKQSNFEELLVKDNSVTIHHRNIQHFAIQMYMVANGMSPDKISEIFQLRQNTFYHPRHTSQFMTHQMHSVYKGSESGSYLGPKIVINAIFSWAHMRTLIFK